MARVKPESSATADARHSSRKLESRFGSFSFLLNRSKELDSGFRRNDEPRKRPRPGGIERTAAEHQALRSCQAFNAAASRSGVSPAFSFC